MSDTGFLLNYGIFQDRISLEFCLRDVTEKTRDLSGLIVYVKRDSRFAVDLFKLLPDIDVYDLLT